MGWCVPAVAVAVQAFEVDRWTGAEALQVVLVSASGSTMGICWSIRSSAQDARATLEQISQERHLPIDEAKCCWETSL